MAPARVHNLFLTHAYHAVFITGVQLPQHFSLDELCSISRPRTIAKLAHDEEGRDMHRFYPQTAGFLLKGVSEDLVSNPSGIRFHYRNPSLLEFPMLGLSLKIQQKGAYDDRVPNVKQAQAV